MNYKEEIKAVAFDFDGEEFSDAFYDALAECSELAALK